jgi:hypothetical protein
MKRYLSEVAQGRFPKRRPLRKNDEFKDFYEVLWRAIDSVKAQRQADAQLLAKSLNIATSGMRQDDPSSKSALDNVAAELKTLCQEIGMELPFGAFPEPEADAPTEDPTRADRDID